MATRKGSEDAAEDPRPEAPQNRIDWTDAGTVMASVWRLHRLKLALLVGAFVFWRVAVRSYVVVPVGSKAVIMEFGKVQAVVPDGIHFTKPWITTVKLISVRVLTASLKAEAVSKDTQKVTTEVVINWTFKPDHLQETYEAVGAEDAMTSGIMLPALNESLKAVTARRPVTDILAQREEIKDEIDDKFRKKMAAYHVNIIDLFLTNLRFEDDYEKAIEAKQVAEVNVKTKQNEAEAARQQAHGEADAAVIKARGEADAKRMLASTLSQANLQLEWIKAWQAGGSQVPQFVSGGNGSSFMMDMSKLKGMATPKPAAPAAEAADGSANQ